ncbi:MAG: hypothetical protein KAS88_00485 [Deltaproteobacteria bacterium]|nr:hypothetical protein [Deltaproteobacteria bacterium]
MVLFRVVLIVIALGLFSFGEVRAAMYSWTDDSGNFHIVDDEEKVPLKYRKEVIETQESAPVVEPPKKRRPVIGGSGVRDNSAVEVSEDYGGHTLIWWKNAIDEKKNALKNFQDSFELKKDYVDVMGVGYSLRRAYKRVEDADGLGTGTAVTARDRKLLRDNRLFTGAQISKYKKYKEEIEDAESIIKRLTKDLDKILREARVNYVPKSITR